MSAGISKPSYSDVPPYPAERHRFFFKRQCERRSYLVECRIGTQTGLDDPRLPAQRRDSLPRLNLVWNLVWGFVHENLPHLSGEKLFSTVAAIRHWGVVIDPRLRHRRLTSIISRNWFMNGVNCESAVKYAHPRVKVLG
jgi:hypothetical protein